MKKYLFFSLITASILILAISSIGGQTWAYFSAVDSASGSVTAGEWYEFSPDGCYIVVEAENTTDYDINDFVMTYDGLQQGSTEIKPEEKFGQEMEILSNSSEVFTFEIHHHQHEGKCQQFTNHAQVDMFFNLTANNNELGGEANIKFDIPEVYYVDVTITEEEILIDTYSQVVESN
ncbi:putative ribosomally synthesized peptide with SipW-like signal peptide [Alkalibacillus filiformis]|uniref:Ribosomally synthesized peptide with SipW-like signal peptide n=1 Tax=Alkalibacillus filiformis TaxID=200990 RepID=A0ABU0DVX5_9BACI|nr:SipW-dependent-type signal peptide-containing protein [Alkalibacillus filiformis]MDQ0352575.1 putative ribosomally synthesized peptide with SipW-like signal peptide [Alkalibacillus filiformis]